jgi:hypothetical protein
MFDIVFARPNYPLSLIVRAPIDFLELSKFASIKCLIIFRDGSHKSDQPLSHAGNPTPQLRDAPPPVAN